MTQPKMPHSITLTSTRLSRAMRKCYDALARQRGISYARMEALLVIRNQEGLSQTELAERLMIETPTLNRTLDGLERDGYVARLADKADKRIRRVVLTESARAEADELTAFSAGLRDALVAGIPEAELDAAEATLDKIFANLDRLSRAKGRDNG
ncbi:MarR family transcriptional regulator, transcriptional regulator for hemolysin [Pseudooceanicola antarcticus]|uniref:MarR family transcriptional regulator n=1 Tax=Pseudooceanicola antarcticus TaxID=1247613 RepID=A0A285HQ31_9RHOB|nr:MarR family transcriptional regulator [Pseudooceanicola antarcticus]PJE27677.1 MarR family transcriptional regulator [Pseudooceanicola antarcticus]SNY37860.1 MarR family transcriptional regulator, transcriptional regulator for hemolysin [Pseudooceanicola antarcticus]